MGVKLKNLHKKLLNSPPRKISRYKSCQELLHTALKDERPLLFYANKFVVETVLELSHWL
jgi:hypothetical protein